MQNIVELRLGGMIIGSRLHVNDVPNPGPLRRLVDNRVKASAVSGRRRIARDLLQKPNRLLGKRNEVRGRLVDQRKLSVQDRVASQSLEHGQKRLQSIEDRVDVEVRQ